MARRRWNRRCRPTWKFSGWSPKAPVMENKDRFKGKTVGLVVSGGNIDSRLLSSVLMRGLVREGRLVRLRIEIPDTPGALSRATGMIGDSGGNIVEVFHQRLFYDISVKQTEIEVVLETINSSHVDDIIKVLVKAGFPTRLLGATSLDSGG